MDAGTEPHQEVTRMNVRIMARGAFVALCLIGMLVLPAAAAQGGQVMKATTGTIDQGLKDELWANHQQYRLQQFDLNIQRATSVITILGKYGVDTTSCQATLATISSKRAALESALSSKDKDAVQTVNEEIKTLWQEFRTQLKDAVKNTFGAQKQGGMSGILSGAMDSTAGIST